MKITFIKPYHKNCWEPLGVGYIASYIKKHFGKSVEIEFFDGNFLKDYSIALETAVRSDIVAFSCTTPTYKKCVSLAKQIKIRNPKVKIVFGGWHVTCAAEVEDPIDQIVIGEGESAFAEILNGNTDSIIYGTKLPFKELYWPDRKLIGQNNYLSLCESICNERIASFQSRRGCSHNCAMCGEHCMSGVYNSKTNPVRLRNVEDLLDEIEYVNHKYDITRIKFVDPTWAFPIESVIKFCDEYNKRNIELPWEAMAHAAYLTKDILSYMASSGCDQLNIGVESGNQDILNSIRKGVTIDKIKKVFHWGKQSGIKMRAFFMIGYPDETEDTIKDTIRLVEQIEPDVFGCTILTPYPGCDFYRKEFKHEDWTNANEYNNDFWYTKNFSNYRLKQFQKMLNERFNSVLVEHQK